MTDTALQKIFDLAEKARAADPNLRYGQAVWHAADVLYPFIVERITGEAGAAAVDPFYKDDSTGAFLALLLDEISRKEEI